jgi:outer membrane protein assembly factor BamB
MITAKSQELVMRHRFHASATKYPFLLTCVVAVFSMCPRTLPAESVDALVDQLETRKGVCAVLGLPDGNADTVLDLSRATDFTIYYQSPDTDSIAAVRQAADSRGLLGTRVFVDRGGWDCIHLADNLADAIVVAPEFAENITEEELLRVLRPKAIAIAGERKVVKEVPAGVDCWSHPYHSPNNNTQSSDELARAPYLTKFLAEPQFCPMPEVAVAAGGRVFRAFGHIAHKANQNAVLNTLLCINAYNGTTLWKRSLPEGFMIHRNTMIATPDVLYLADHESCKQIDAATGKVLDEIVVPDNVTDGPVWKWMALVDGVLYALAGGHEVPITTQRSRTPGLGHWPWGMWEGHDYADPKTAFGFGRTFLAINPKTKEVLWSYRDNDFLDSRGVCMNDMRIYFYSPEKFLGCLDAHTGQVVWKNKDADLLAAIGPQGRAQHYVTGYATTTYIKSFSNYLFFAGPQRSHLAVARAEDGKLLWKKEHGNFQLVLREDGVYAAGPQQRDPDVPNTGFKLDYETGDVLATLPMRRACTRATGSVDSIFFRASGGTVRIATATNTAKHIAPMRPPCQSGVIISDGNLYWGPWMCGCQLSLYGHICLTSAKDFDFHPEVDESRLERHSDSTQVQSLNVQAGDWPTYQGDNARSATLEGQLPTKLAQAWKFQLPSKAFPTAPVTAGESVFFGDRQGKIHAVNAANGKLLWQAFTSGPIYFPPAIEDGRLFVGSADGRVHAYEAATGKPLWTFRVAPAERWIPVYGRLISTWPVAGGVVVQDGVVYAAAGIAHYDGTHVVALDASSGAVKWFNDTSGTTSVEVDHGVSLQGSLSIRDGELRFVAGGVHEEARYDLTTGECLNEPFDAPRSLFHTAFYAYFPDYGRYTSLNRPFSDGSSLCYDCTYEGSWHGELMLLPAPPEGQPRPRKPVSRWGTQRQRPRRSQAVWQQPGWWFNSFISSDHVLLTAGHNQPDAAESTFLTAVDMKDGSTLWQQQLPGPVVKSGLAVNHAKQVFVSLENGLVLAFRSADSL